MARSAFYEESAISLNEKKERRTYQVFHIAGIAVLVFAGVLVLLSLTTVPSILMNEELSAASKAVTIAFLLLPILSLIGFFFLFRYIKRRNNVSFDYTFVEDELRVTKVFNNRSRKHLHTFKAEQIMQIGYVESTAFDRAVAGLNGKKAIPLTPNVTPAEGKEFIYLICTVAGEKRVYVIECRQELLEFLVLAAGRNKFERK